MCVFSQATVMSLLNSRGLLPFSLLRQKFRLWASSLLATLAVRCQRSLAHILSIPSRPTSWALTVSTILRLAFRRPLGSGLSGSAMLSRTGAMTLTPSACSSPQWYRNTDTTCHQGHMALRTPTSPKAWSVRPRWRSATPSAVREPSHEKTVAPAGSEILVYPIVAMKSNELPSLATVMDSASVNLVCPPLCLSFPGPFVRISGGGTPKLGQSFPASFASARRTSSPVVGLPFEKHTCLATHPQKTRRGTDRFMRKKHCLYFAFLGSKDNGIQTERDARRGRSWSASTLRP